MSYYSATIILQTDNVHGFLKMVNQAHQMGCDVSMPQASIGNDGFLVQPIGVRLPDNVSFDLFTERIKSITDVNTWEEISQDEFLTYQIVDVGNLNDWDSITNWDLNGVATSVARYNDRVYKQQLGEELSLIEILGLNEQTLSMFSDFGYKYIDDILQKLNQKTTGIDGRPVGEATILHILNEDRTAYVILIEKLKQHGFL